MSYLYENEDISIYNAVNDDYEQAQVIVEDVDKYVQRGAAAHELMQTAGWTLVQEFIAAEEAKYTKYLLNSEDYPQVCRLQAAIKSLKSIDSFLQSCIWEASVATDNHGSGPTQGEDE